MIITRLETVPVSSSWGLMRQGGSYYVAQPVAVEGEAWGRGQNLEEEGGLLQ